MICDAKIFHFKIDPKHIQKPKVLHWHCKLVTQGMVARTISSHLDSMGNVPHGQVLKQNSWLLVLVKLVWCCTGAQGFG
jgi:hypothetical protein